MIGLGRSRRYMGRSRRDILAVEDRSFKWVNVSREGSASYGAPSARSSIRGLSHTITERFASIRNLARGAGSAPHSWVPSSVTDWEKIDRDPFSPEVVLMADGLARDELSASSLQTANTETLERLGRTMDIIQRDGTLVSQHTPLTGAFSLDDNFCVSAGGTQQSRPLIVFSAPSTRSARTASWVLISTTPISLSVLTNHSCLRLVQHGSTRPPNSELPRDQLRFDWAWIAATRQVSSTCVICLQTATSACSVRSSASRASSHVLCQNSQPLRCPR
jgi:hypothetical protein